MGQRKNNKGFIYTATLLMLFGRTVVAATLYVSPSGSQMTPYTNWNMAANTIQSAIDAAVDNDHIVVSTGTFYLTSQLLITNNITVFSISGAQHTAISGQSICRCLEIDASNAVFEGFTIKNGYRSDSAGGGGVYCNGGLIQSCIIVSNADVEAGGGIYLSGGAVLRNSLIIYNHSHSGGGVFCWGSFRVDNCTISRNTADSRGGLLCFGEGTIYNTVMSENTPDDFYIMGDDTYYTNCFWPEFPLMGDPLFVSPDAGDYTLQSNSPCINSGVLEDWMTEGTKDLQGDDRIWDFAPDIGAYEYSDDLIRISFWADRTSGPVPLAVVFQASVFNAETNDIFFNWDFDGDHTSDKTGQGLAVVTNVYNDAGIYNVMLTVSNLMGQTRSVEQRKYISACDSNETNALRSAYAGVFWGTTGFTGASVSGEATAACATGYVAETGTFQASAFATSTFSSAGVWLSIMSTNTVFSNQYAEAYAGCSDVLMITGPEGNGGISIYVSVMSGYTLIGDYPNGESFSRSTLMHECIEVGDPQSIQFGEPFDYTLEVYGELGLYNTNELSTGKEVEYHARIYEVHVYNSEGLEITNNYTITSLSGELFPRGTELFYGRDISNRICMKWHGPTSHYYTVQYSTNICSEVWRDVDEDVWGTGTTNFYQLPLTGDASRVYRLLQNQ